MLKDLRKKFSEVSVKELTFVERDISNYKTDLC